jgi:carbonic anhydrase
MSTTDSNLSYHPSHSAKPVEKPRNGIKGLRHMRYDLLAGLVVSLVSLPLSSGIAIASGAPPIYGIISAIVAGLVFPFVGGAYVTIAGPAAGLAPALMVTMVALGGAGDADHVGVGYPFLLVVIFFVGVLQVILSRFGLARFAAIFPLSVVEGMLGAIGLLIIVKSLPMFFGYVGHHKAHGFLEYLASIPKYASEGNATVTLIAVAALALMLGLSSSRIPLRRGLKTVPPQLFAVAFGVAVAWFLRSRLPSGLFIQLPADPFSSIQLPAFGEMFRRTDLWQAAIVGIVTLTLIDGVESLATALAVDRIDPFRRRSESNHLLAAMGFSNIVSSLVGGLTIIPGGVKSKTNIAAGGRTLWANFTNAICLLVFLLLAPGLIALIPKAVLGAVLVFTGWKMCHPAIARHVARVGSEQLLLYGFTIAVTLVTDLLWGIVAGTLLEWVLDTRQCGRVAAARHGRTWPTLGRVLAMGRDMLRNPVVRRVLEGGVYRLEIERPLVAFNAVHLGREIDRAPTGTQRVEIVLGRGATMVDHTACDTLMALCEPSGHRFPVGAVGLERMHPLSSDSRAVRLQPEVHLGEQNALGKETPWSDMLTAATAGMAAASVAATLAAAEMRGGIQDADENEDVASVESL